MTGRLSRRRRGSALVLVLIMTLSMAGLAISAVLLTSNTSLTQRYYDKDKDFRYYARAAVALVKATVQRDTTLTIPSDTAYRALTAYSISDASGTASATIRVNGYATYTGDTAGTNIPFLTVIGQAYDTLGTRSVLRLDAQSESFSRYQIFVDSFASTVSVPADQYVRGRVHGNRNWVSASSGPGPYYFDTVSAVGSVSGTASYNGISAVTGAKRIAWPTTSSASITRLSSLATAGNLSFAPVSGSSQARCSTTPAVEHSGQYTTTVGFCISGLAYTSGFSAINVARGSRLRFRPVDVNNNGTYDASEGFFEVFDLASGMDTSSLRADMPKTTGSISNIVTLNQCGLLVTISGRREFFPVSRFRETWVLTRILGSTAPLITTADTTTMRARSGNLPTAGAINKILSYGTGYSRCFPAGSPYLMLAERYVNSSCSAIDSSTASTPWGWGATGAGCSSGAQYGGQDTTFTPNVRRCAIRDTGVCDAAQFRLGSWRTYGGTNTASPPAAVMQSTELTSLWPISSTYNSASRGVISATSGPLFVSDTLRGFATLYVNGAVVFVNDRVYDPDPTDAQALCRNFLGLISTSSARIANNGLNHPRPDPGGTYRFLGTPNFTIHGIIMPISGPFGVEDSTAAQALSTPLACNGTNTSGGCINLTGGAVQKIYRPTHSTGTANSGLIFNRALDPCQEQKTNRRPPFFPLTGRYVDYKWTEIDSRDGDTWAEIKTYLARLRGNNRAVP